MPDGINPLYNAFTIVVTLFMTRKYQIIEKNPNLCYKSIDID
jgi:hypothetical protein